MISDSRELVRRVGELHRPVAYINRQRCCVTCFDNKGKPHLWPCPTGKLIWP